MMPARRLTTVMAASLVAGLVMVGVVSGATEKKATALATGVHLWDESGGRPSFVDTGHDADLYLLQEDRELGSRFGEGPSASLSPSGEIVAMLTGARGTTFYRAKVTRVHGGDLVGLDSALSFAWSPSSRYLAIVRGVPSETEIPFVHGVTIIDVATEETTQIDATPLNVSWQSENTLLLDHVGWIDTFSIKTRAIEKSSLHGRFVSPDGRFSISAVPEDIVRIWDEDRGIEITATLTTITSGIEMRTMPMPFWLAGEGHVLVVPGCDYGPIHGSARRPPRCVVLVLDPSKRVVLRQYPMRALVTSSDFSGFFARTARGVHFVRVQAKQ